METTGEDKHQAAQEADSELVRRAIANPDAFLDLVNRYENRLLRYAKWHSDLSHEEALDVLQETFLKVYRHLNDYEPSLRLENWIYRILRNCLIDWNRRNRRHVEHRISFDLLPERGWLSTEGTMRDHSAAPLDTTDVLERIVKKQEEEALVRAIGELPLTYRDAAMLRFIENMDYGDISDILRKPKSTVSSLIRRAQRILLAKLKEGQAK